MCDGTTKLEKLPQHCPLDLTVEGRETPALHFSDGTERWTVLQASLLVPLPPCPGEFRMAFIFSRPSPLLLLCLPTQLLRLRGSGQRLFLRSFVGACSSSMAPLNRR